MPSRVTAPDPVPTGAPDKPPPELVEQLASQLAEKDELVTALTEQLERAAEQLDRLQRSGADRRRGGFMPAEASGEQKQLVGDLQRLVQQWDEMQAGATLGRIEVQLTELRDFIAGRLNGRVDSRLESSDAFSGSQETLPAGQSAEDQSSPSQGSEWERIKSQLLEPESQPATSEAVATPEPLPEPPPPVNVANATPETLLAAIETRDEYIANVLRRLRIQEAVALPTDWSQLDASAPEWSERLQGLAQMLEEKLRLAEVELSMERARVARESGRLMHQQEIIDKHLKRLGLTNVEDAENAAPLVGSHQDRRWARFLGKRRDE